jgi:SNF2 family DNA or RNA helicase
VTTIHCEITGDGEQLVLIAGGVDIYGIAEQAKRLQTLTPLFKPSDPPGALLCPLTWPAVVQLSATYGDWFRPGPRLSDWITEEVRVRQNTPDYLVAPTPPGLTPYPWQVSGAAMIGAVGRVLITDEPGTGKTVTTILGLVEWQSRNLIPTEPKIAKRPGPILVVCPASVVDPWVEHWNAWAPHLRAVAWRGGKRKALMGTAEVYVMSYEIAAKDNPVAGAKEMKPLVAMKPAALVVDECHYIKNPQAERSKAVRRLAKHIRKTTDGAVVGLSGTPITHGPSNLWPILEALEPLAWPSGDRYKNRYCEIVAGDYKDDELGLNRFTEPEFRLTLLGQHRRVAKADVLADLPPKVYSTRTVQLPATWRKAYDEFEGRMLTDLPDEGGEMRVMDVLTKFNLLTRLASSAADVEYTYGPDIDEYTGEPKEHIHLELKNPSWKVDAMLEVLAERVPDRQQIATFASSAQLIRLAGKAAEDEGYRVGYIIGGQSQGERTRNREAFQAGELDMIGVTTGAGGTGLTLTAASTALVLQRPWSLVESIQLEDRLHRIGAEHESIDIIDVIASATIDTRVRAILRERAGQLADLVGDPRIASELLGGNSRAQPIAS